MSFTSDIRAHVKRAKNTTRKTFVNGVSIIFESVTDGSPITGAPGQPVQSGNLKGSIHVEFLSEWIASITTRDVPYAKGIEDGIGPHGLLTLRSSVGGFHSFKITRHAWESNIIPAAAAKASGR